MSVLFVTLPVALGISLICVWVFVRMVRSGQFDDLETPAHRILFDDVELKSTNKEAGNAETNEKENS
ncbi:MAG: cbb3-type cytochrome oxidase assembly protein CcoS [Pirellulaceae bacterium]